MVLSVIIWSFVLKLWPAVVILRSFVVVIRSNVTLICTLWWALQILARARVVDIVLWFFVLFVVVQVDVNLYIA